MYNGDEYEGEIKNSLPDGQGTFTYPDENKNLGEYQNDNMYGLKKMYNLFWNEIRLLQKIGMDVLHATLCNSKSNNVFI